MSRYSHMYLVAVTVETDEQDPSRVSEAALAAALARRLADVLEHDGREAFGHEDSERLS